MKYKCQICGFHEYDYIHESDNFRGNVFDYVICKRCSFVSQMNCEDKDKYLSLPYQTQDNYEEHSKNRAAYIYDFCRDDLHYDMDVFDIGCSRGGVIKYIKQILPDSRVSGCTVLVENEKFISDELDIINKDFDDITFDKKYDFIIMSHTLEHFIDLRKTLNNVKNIMKDSSKLYIEVPYLDYLKVRLSFEYCPEHISYFTPNSLQNLLLSSGFKILKIKSSKYWGNIKVLLEKNNLTNIQKKPYIIMNKNYLFYKTEKKLRSFSHWFYRLGFKFFKIKSND